MSKGTVFVGLSGGVDSAVSAALLKKEGYDVCGVFIRIALEGYPCPAGEDKVWAMRAAAHLRIAFQEIDLSDAYRTQVFELSMQEFAQGRTPNPDAICNREIKFGLFFDWCMEQGADFVATGHYAQAKDGMLYAGRDSGKDQSYFLWAVPHEKLSKVLFPVGGMEKTQVRAMAAALGLPHAGKKDSQGLCFLGGTSIEDMLMRELKPVPGNVLDESGRTIGTHDGAALYTLGQRHGFTLQRHSPETPPHFIIDKDIKLNTITVSPERLPTGASQTVVTLGEENWIGDVPDGPCEARYRYRGALIPAHKEEGGVVLLEPHYTPEGQSLVLYRKDRCLGGGVIAKARLS